MLIKLLKDNTVTAAYKDGTSENVNSGHSHKALTPEAEALAEAFTYMADTSTEPHPEISFNGHTVRAGQAVVTPLDVKPTDTRLATFCGIVLNDEARQVFIEQLPLVPVMGEEQQVYVVPEGTPKAVEQVQKLPEGITAVQIIDGVATSVTVYEQRRWVLKVVEEDGSPHMAPTPLLDEDGEPVLEHFHQKTGQRFPAA